MRMMVVAAALALAIPATAQAQSEELLDCTTVGVTPAFRDRIADAMLDEGANSDALFEQLVAVADGCATRFGLPEDKGEAYFTYSLSRLARDTFVARLGAAGLSAQVVDDVFDFGPGRGNPVITGSLSEAQIGQLIAALAAVGVDVEAVPDSSWAMIGAYAASSSLMWQARRKLP